MTTLTNARLVDGTLVDLVVDDAGIVTAHHPAGTAPADTDTVDLGGGLTLPALAEPHAHLDKALSADVVPNPAGDLMGAIEAWRARYHERTVDEIAERARRAVDLAVRNGVTTLRTHVDVGEEIGLRAVEALVGVRAAVADRVDLTLVALGVPHEGSQIMRAAIEAGVDVVGGCPHLEDDPEDAVDQAFRLAVAADLPVDLHVDETLDPSKRSLDAMARWVLDHGFDAPVAASHCVSLAMRPEDEQRSAARLVAEAEVAVIALPQTNLFLQSRGQHQAPPRGLAPVGLLREEGVLVAAGGDNVQDPFNTVGRGDPLETAALMVMAGHLTPEAAYRSVSDDVRAALGVPPAGPEVGRVADLLVTSAATVRELVASAPADRTVIRRGRVVCRTTLTTRW